MAVIGINLSDTFGTWVNNFDTLGINLGDLSLLTTERDSNLVLAINSIDSALAALTATVNLLDSNVSDLQQLNIDSANITTLTAINLIADSATLNYIQTLNADFDSARIPTLSSVSTNIIGLTVVDLSADSARIPTLSSTTLTANNILGDSATFSSSVNAANFNSTSDIKFKENVATLENSINTLNNIRPVSFNWIGGEKSYGVIAQELEKILPELVNEDKYGIKRVSYTPIIALLIDAIKAHEVEIQNLKNCQCSCK